MLWLSPENRSLYRQQTENSIQAGQFVALAIRTVVADLFTELERTGPPEKLFSADQLPQLQDDISRYIRSQDIIALQILLQQWPDLHLRRLLDLNTKAAFLLVSSENGSRPFLAANLFPRSLEQSVRLSADKPERSTVDAYVASRAAWLLIGVGP